MLVAAACEGSGGRLPAWDGVGVGPCGEACGSGFDGLAAHLGDGGGARMVGVPRR